MINKVITQTEAQNPKPLIRYICLNCGVTFYRAKGRGRNPRFHSDLCRVEYNNKETANMKYEKALDILITLLDDSLPLEMIQKWNKRFTISFVNNLGYKWINKQWYKD